jgi:hypothetical protein
MNISFRNNVVTEEGMVQINYNKEMENTFKYDFAHRNECALLVDEYFTCLPTALTAIKAVKMSNALTIIEDAEKEVVISESELTGNEFSSPVSIPMLSKDDFSKETKGKAKFVMYYNEDGLGKVTSLDEEFKKTEEAVKESEETGKQAETIIEENAPKTVRSCRED